MSSTFPALATLAVFSTIAGTLVFASSGTAAQEIRYPHTRQSEQSDTYFGTTVADPYRWLEDDRSAETDHWVAEENQVTNDYLAKIPYRSQIRTRLEQLGNHPRYSAPFKHGKDIFFYKNSGLQNQPVLYVQNGLNGKPEVIIDPNTLAADGTTRLTSFTLSRNGKYAAYGISLAGSDWQELHVMDLATRKTLPDAVKWIKFSGPSWKGDGFFYSRYPEPAKGAELTAANSNRKVYYHKIGTAQDQDTLVYEDRQHPNLLVDAVTTEDERFLILYVQGRTVGKQGNALYYRNLAGSDTTFKPIIDTVGDAKYAVLDNLGDRFLIITNHNASNAKVCLYDPKILAEKDWKEVIPEKPEPMEGFGIAGNKLFVTYSKDVTSHVYIYRMDGKLENEVTLPAPGSVRVFSGRKEDGYVFFAFTSYVFPATLYRYDLASHKTTLFRAPEIPNFKSDDYQTVQVFYPSKDGTKIPMFLVHRKEMKREGANPTLLYGYGGFGDTQSPGFSSADLVLLQQGFVLAFANLRGGGEYGEKWHEAGTKLNKQNVFDDFIAAAEYLIANKYTSPEHLAIQGASNGGLLVGAVINQRPDLFKVAIPQVGVMDMLRFQKFTGGAFWRSEYGSSDDETQFRYLYRYSPLHNIREGVKYPATLITTADHDDRVVPAHSFKYTATLQAKSSGNNPILIRIDTNAGHGGSSLAKRIQETVDIDAFLFYNLGVTPTY
ncbi:MAG TPA: prolyl oligopeptidase family serine peptidase [Chthonomonadaceae bacterium]|nr:prolyl oligopeptidase family serine peptidase [Chthonomonadaceae bacterium]